MFTYLFLVAALQSAFATAVFAGKKSSRGVVSANLLITATEPASVPGGLNTNKSAVPSRPMEKYQMRTSGRWKPEKEKRIIFSVRKDFIRQIALPSINHFKKNILLK